MRLLAYLFQSLVAPKIGNISYLLKFPIYFHEFFVAKIQLLRKK